MGEARAEGKDVGSEAKVGLRRREEKQERGWQRRVHREGVVEADHGVYSRYSKNAVFRTGRETGRARGVERVRLEE